MSFWNRLQKFLPRAQNSLKADDRSGSLVEVVISVGILWGLQTWGPQPLEKEKPFKELHQPRTLSYSKDDDAPAELQ